jgi:hypothetical protein
MVFVTNSITMFSSTTYQTGIVTNSLNTAATTVNNSSYIDNVSINSSYSRNTVEMATGTSTNEILYRTELMKYDRLKHTIMDNFKLYMTYFKQGNFSILDDTFNETEANYLGQTLLNNTFKQFTNQEINLFTKNGTLYSNTINYTDSLVPDYNSFMYLLIDGLKSAILLNKKNIDCASSMEQLIEYKNILTNTELLKKYIEDNYNSFNSALINVDMDIKTTLSIKPEYITYIQTYGMPENGIFDSELLNAIIYDIDNTSTTSTTSNTITA